MGNNCEKHKNFIPSCKACKAKRDAGKSNPPKKKTPTANTQVIDMEQKKIEIRLKQTAEEIKVKVQLEKNMALCCHLYEVIVIGPKMIRFMHLYFEVMENAGYTLVMQIVPGVGTTEYKFLFRKQEQE